MKEQKKSINNRGITVIGLIVIVIVAIIILAIFISKLSNGKQKSEWSYTTKGIEKKETIVQIGDKVLYNPKENALQQSVTSQKVENGHADQIFTLNNYSNGWKVLGIEEGCLMLIAETPIKPDNYGLYNLKGKEGYSNIEKELNKICKLYGQGAHAKEARSITVEDINKITGYNPECIGVKNPSKQEIEKGTRAGINETIEASKYKEGTIGYIYNETVGYGNELTYYWDENQNLLYKTETGKSSKLTKDYSENRFYWFDFQNNLWQSTKNNGTIKIKNSDYEYYPETLTNEYNEFSEVGISRKSKEFKLLFEGTDKVEKRYFLASKSCGATLWGIRYPIKMIDNEKVMEFEMLKSTGEEGAYNGKIRPVVILDADVTLTQTADGWTLN